MRPSLWREPRAVPVMDPWPQVSQAYADRQLSRLQEIGSVNRTLAILERPARPLIIEAWIRFAREILGRQFAVDHSRRRCCWHYSFHLMGFERVMGRDGGKPRAAPKPICGAQPVRAAWELEGRGCAVARGLLLDATGRLVEERRPAAWRLRGFPPRER